MISSQTKIVLAFILLVGMLSLPGFSQAIGEIGPQDGDISVTTVPENPEPYQDVTINLTSYAADLNKATIEWRSGSSLLLSGIGRTSYSFKALGPNTSSVINVTISLPGGIDKITKQIIVSPSEIDVLWESVDGYTPPFYRGKSFVSAESLIKAVAIPNTGAIRSGKSNTVYNWKNNGSTVLSASGYGKNSYIFANNELNKSEEITVSASSVDSSYGATKTIKIPLVTPKIIFYKKSPTEGVLYDNALLNETFVSEDEITVVAVPYFLALNGNEDKFSYTWKINGQNIDTPEEKTVLTVRPASRGGYATINIVMENLSKFFQKANGSLKLNL